MAVKEKENKLKLLKQILQEGQYHMKTVYSSQYKRNDKSGRIEIKHHENKINCTYYSFNNSKFISKYNYFYDGKNQITTFNTSVTKDSSHTGQILNIGRNKCVVKGTGFSNITNSNVEFIKFFQLSDNGYGYRVEVYFLDENEPNKSKRYKLHSTTTAEYISKP